MDVTDNREGVVNQWPGVVNQCDNRWQMTIVRLGGALLIWMNGSKCLDSKLIHSEGELSFLINKIFECGINYINIKVWLGKMRACEKSIFQMNTNIPKIE